MAASIAVAGRSGSARSGAGGGMGTPSIGRSGKEGREGFGRLLNLFDLRTSFRSLATHRVHFKKSTRYCAVDHANLGPVNTVAVDAISRRFRRRCGVNLPKDRLLQYASEARDGRGRLYLNDIPGAGCGAASCARSSRHARMTLAPNRSTHLRGSAKSCVEDHESPAFGGR